MNDRPLDPPPGAGHDSSGTPAPPQLHIDSDWKAQAQAEKDRLAKQEAERERSKPQTGAPGELPPVDFRTIVHLLASQGLMSLGGYGDQETGRVVVDLPGAKLMIDLMGVLEAKTKGNLSEEEATELRAVIGELRARFVHFAELVARQQAGGGRMAGEGGPGGVVAPSASSPPSASGGMGSPRPGIFHP